MPHTPTGGSRPFPVNGWNGNIPATGPPIIEPASRPVTACLQRESSGRATGSFLSRPGSVGVHALACWRPGTAFSRLYAVRRFVRPHPDPLPQERERAIAALGRVTNWWAHCRAEEVSPSPWGRGQG